VAGFLAAQGLSGSVAANLAMDAPLALDAPLPVAAGAPWNGDDELAGIQS
jgi:hypothetical protein